MNEHDDLQALIDAATPALAVNAEVARAGADRFEAHAHWEHGLRRRAATARRILLVGGAVYVVLMAILSAEFFQQAQVAAQKPSTHFDAWRLVLLETVIVFVIPLSLATIAAWLVGRRGFAAQVTGRAMLWGLTLLVGLVELVLLQMAGPRVTASGTTSLPAVILPAAILFASLAFVGALLVLGNHGLRSPERGAFRPVAFSRLLSLSLVLGLADAVVIGAVFAFVLAVGDFQPILLGLCALLCASAYGLFRLRTWGLAAMALSNLAEIVLASRGLLGDILPLIGLLMVTAAVQLVLPVPVYGAMFRGHVAEGAQARWMRHIPTVVLVSVGLGAVLQFVWIVAGRP